MGNWQWANPGTAIRQDFIPLKRRSTGFGNCPVK